MIHIGAGTTIRAAVRDSRNTGHDRELGMYKCRSYILDLSSATALYSLSLNYVHTECLYEAKGARKRPSKCNWS